MHSIVPVPLDLSRMIDIKKVYLCVRNALDLAMEEGARTIVSFLKVFDEIRDFFRVFPRIFRDCLVECRPS